MHSSWNEVKIFMKSKITFRTRIFLKSKCDKENVKKGGFEDVFEYAFGSNKILIQQENVSFKFKFWYKVDMIMTEGFKWFLIF